RAAARSVALEMLGRDDRRWQERGVRLLSTVATASDLAPWMVKFVRDATLPIGVPLAKALGTWLGDSPEQRRLARDVARRLPVSLRIRPFRRHLGLAGLTVSVLAAIPLWNITQHATPVDATLVRVVATGDSATMAFAVPLSMAGWDASTLIDGRPASPYAGASSLYDYPQASPLLQSTGERLSEHAYSDSGGSDIDVIAVNGRVTRVTSAPGDDVPDAWSPDGQFIAFHSSRWSVLRHHRLGILDRATGAVRRLTRSDGREGIAMWSPDGSRLVFVRDYQDGRPTQMCIIGIDGDDERCTTFVASILGWRDPQAIMMYGGNKLLVLHPGRSLAIDTLISTTGSPTLSPNGRWLAWWTGTASGSVGVVAPSSDPQDARRIRWGRNMQAPGPLLWGARGVPAPYVERLSVSSMTDTVFVGVPHRFELAAKWSDSTESTPPYVRWRLGAAADGTIDSAGTLVAARPGTIVVVASAGGWRTTSTRVVAVAATTHLIASEHWATGFTDWRPFGDPLPTVVHDPLMGAAVLNNGDGSYFSGVYHKGTLRSARGLAIDAVISTAVTALQWQTIDLHLYAAMDREALDAWDHRTGFLPAGRRPPGADCLFSYPGSEGIDGLATIVPLPGPVPGAERRPLRLANGTPYRVRLQVFPDGRCGMAVNGAALFISNGRFARDATFRLVSYGNSWKTRMLLGPLAILTGVPGDVDWTHVVRDIPPVMPPGPVRPP
ncbi:MAG: hypothetical protein NTW72_02740, partial [Gemmatimonadetes bacterium]|nr:hypothetical protein [Gemmatimonadota bacterium]